MTEVTQAQWLAVMGSWPGTAPDETKGLGDGYPAYNLTWDDIAGPAGFLEKLNTYLTTSGQAAGGKPLRLPSEAEWEYACRGGTQTAYSYGATADGAYMWYQDNRDTYGSPPEPYFKPVGLKLPNSLGLYDMHGNAFEWCQDWYHSSYVGAPADGSAWETPTGTVRVTRGGGYHSSPEWSRAAFRWKQPPGSHGDDFGFRLVRTR